MLSKGIFEDINGGGANHFKSPVFSGKCNYYNPRYTLTYNYIFNKMFWRQMAKNFTYLHSIVS